MQTEYRESLQREADEAIYARRAHAVEKERQIKQSELAAEIELAERRKELVDTEAHNKLKLAEASVKSQEMELAIYEAVPPTTVAALALKAHRSSLRRRASHHHYRRRSTARPNGWSFRCASPFPATLLAPRSPMGRSAGTTRSSCRRA
ncbi:hypothetical protein [Mesorhizobium sp. CAU 1732]|uniref:hypothetical protein n=1 Tax=Mesorhizobium sp. CAU 1732 TaxID=3140358 RepID=UPI0032608E26